MDLQGDPVPANICGEPVTLKPVKPHVCAVRYSLLTYSIVEELHHLFRRFPGNGFSNRPLTAYDSTLLHHLLRGRNDTTEPSCWA